MDKIIKCDIAIIGAGSGGLTVAAVAAQLDLDVVLIEADKMGGDCLNYGCVPSKALLAAARHAHQHHDASLFGLKAVPPEVDFAGVMAHVRRVINTIAPNDSEDRFAKLGAKVIRESASFIDERTIRAGDYVIQAKHIVVATGSSPAIPPIPGLADVPYLTNETVFSLEQQPEHLLVVGAGPIGCEMAQAFCLLGTKVTVLEAFTMMPRDEPELVAMLRKQLEGAGIEIIEKVEVINVREAQGGIEVVHKKDGNHLKIAGTHVLVAAGRKPNVEQLALDQANIKYSSKGIEVDERLRSTNKHVYAIGDVAGSYQFTHIASYHAGIALRNILFKWPARVNYRAVPWVTYTNPPLAHVGMSEQEARKSGKSIDVMMLDYSENDRAVAEEMHTGKLKVICTKKGKILGVSIFGPRADELIVPWILLINEGKTLKSLSSAIIPYPTLSELSKRAASQFYSPKLYSGLIKYLVAFLKRI